MKTTDFVAVLDNERITRAIADAETRTSGQLRVFISHRNVDDPLEAARVCFQKLGMEKTIERNGILIFFAPETRKYALIGDAGIDARCGGDGFWRGVVSGIMRPYLLRGDYTEAIVQAVGEVGQQLARHFPPRTDGSARNELPDSVETD